MLVLQFLPQFAHMASRKWWSCGSFYSTTHDLSHKQVMAKGMVLTFFQRKWRCIEKTNSLLSP